MNVRIGIITMGVREIRDLLTDYPVDVYVDTERKGVAHARNTLLKRFYDEGADYIFMFDDDCYPVMRGWEQYFIDMHLVHGHHFFGIPEAFKGEIKDGQGEMIRWAAVCTPFAFFTRKVIETVGYYNTAYNRYGCEDSAYNYRVWRSGLIGNEPGFPSPLRAIAYIHSMDIFSENPVANLSFEEKQSFIDSNKYIYETEINSSQIYYPFEQ